MSKLIGVKTALNHDIDPGVVVLAFILNTQEAEVRQLSLSLGIARSTGQPVRQILYLKKQTNNND